MKQRILPSRDEVTTFVADVESRNGLPVDAENFIHQTVSGAKSYEDIYKTLTAGLAAFWPGKFWLYRGGSHIAIHRNLKGVDKRERLVIIREDRNIFADEPPTVDDAPQGHEMVCSFDDDSIVPNPREVVA